MNGDNNALTGQLLNHQASAISTDGPDGSGYTRQGSSSSSSSSRRRSSIGSSQKSSRRGSQRAVGSAASAPSPPRYYQGDTPPGPAKYRWPTEEPQLAEARLRDGVCRVADTCGNPDTGASGCYFIFRGYPCIVTSLLQVPNLCIHTHTHSPYQVAMLSLRRACALKFSSLIRCCASML